LFVLLGWDEWRGNDCGGIDGWWVVDDRYIPCQDMMYVLCECSGEWG
jgi:hypothetical protein